MPDAGAIRAGKAFVELTADDGPLTRGLAVAQRKLKAWGESLTAIGSRLAAGGGVIGAPLAAAAKTFVDGGAALSDMSKRTGVAVETLSALGYAAEQGGADLDTVEKALRKISMEAVKAAGGGQEATEALAALGLSANDLKNLSPDKMLELVGRKIQALPNPANRAAVAMRLLGEEGGTKLLPFLEQLAAGAPEAARALGLVTSTEEANSAKALSQAWKTLTAAGARAVAVVGSALAPALQSVADILVQTIQPALAWVSANKELAVVIAGVAVGAVALGATLAGLGVALTAMVPVVAALAAAGQLLLNPWVLLGGAVAAVVYKTGLYKPVLEALEPGIARVTDLFMDLGETGANAWTGIKDAIAAGDLQLAGKVAFAGLDMAWTLIANQMKETWRNFTRYIVEAFHGAWNAIADMLTSLPGAGWVTGMDPAELKKGLAEDAALGAKLREAERQAARNADDAALTQAAQALSDAMEAAREARQASERRREPQVLAAAVPDLQAIHQRLSSVGTFNAFGARGLGGDQQSRIAAAAEETARNTKETVRQFKDLAKGLTFG